MERDIVGQKSFLTPLKESDISAIADWSLDPLLCKAYHNCISLQESYLRDYIISPKEENKIYLINTIDDKVIGRVSIEIVPEDSCANIDMVIAEKVYTGKGYGKDALKLVIKLCFDELGLDCVKMVIKADNMRAEYCCWGCGMREDKYYLPEDKWENTVRMALYKKDYLGY